MAKDLPHPPGFYGERAPSSLHLFSHNNNSTPEMNFNEYVYFFSDTGRLTTKVLDVDILRSIIAKPLERQALLDKLMMVNEVGDIAPAHLPNIADVIGNADVQAIIVELEDGQVEYDGATQLVPKKLKEKVDPKPKIRRSRPIYSIGEKFTCDFGSYTDDILYFQFVLL